MTISIDSELTRLVDELEQACDAYSTLLLAEAGDESAYKYSFHAAKLAAIENGDTAAKAESVAYVAAAGKLSEWNHAKALVAAQRELLAMYRTRVEACRTLAANQRLV